MIVVGWLLVSVAINAMAGLFAPGQVDEGETLRPRRSLIAGGLGSWLAHFAWLDSVLIDPQETPELAVSRILEACSWDPGNAFFRTQGAGILAFDLGVEAGGAAAEDYARKGLRLLDDGRPWVGHANLAAIDFAYGKILSTRLGEDAQALRYFQRAAGRLPSGDEEE